MKLLKTIHWEFPTPIKTIKEIKPTTTIEVKLNDQRVLSEDAKQFIDYLSDSIVTKNSKAIMKRNIYIQTLEVAYKIGVLLVVVKFFPEILSILFNLKG